MIQAVTIPLATPQRTADTFFAAPTPMMQPVMVCVVDTGMQEEIRSSEGFPLRGDFVGLKERGELASPAAAAAAVIRLMGSDNFGEQLVTRV